MNFMNDFSHHAPHYPVDSPYNTVLSYSHSCYTSTFLHVLVLSWSMTGLGWGIDQTFWEVSG